MQNFQDKLIEENYIFFEKYELKILKKFTEIFLAFSPRTPLASCVHEFST